MLRGHLNYTEHNFLFLQLNGRICTSIAEKKRQLNYIGVGVTPQAQKLFNAITKTYVLCLFNRFYFTHVCVYVLYIFHIHISLCLFMF